MKRKKNSEKASLSSFGTLDPPEDAKKEEISLVRSLRPKILILFAFLSCILDTGRAESSECPAGHYCVQDLSYPCQEGFYSLDGDTECNRCPYGKNLNFKLFLKYSINRILLSHDN